MTWNEPYILILTYRTTLVKLETRLTGVSTKYLVEVSRLCFVVERFWPSTQAICPRLWVAALGKIRKACLGVFCTWIQCYRDITWSFVNSACPLGCQVISFLHLPGSPTYVLTIMNIFCGIVMVDTILGLQWYFVLLYWHVVPDVCKLKGRSEWGMYERSCYCHNNFISFKYKQVMVFWIVMPSKKSWYIAKYWQSQYNTITVYIEILRYCDIFIATYHNIVLIYCCSSMISHTKPFQAFLPSICDRRPGYEATVFILIKRKQIK